MLCTRLLSNQQKDRGYAWVVVFLAFCCHTVVWGLSYTIGIWTSTFEDAFGASKAVTSTIGSGLTGINYVAGQCYICKDFKSDKWIFKTQTFRSVGKLIVQALWQPKGHHGWCLDWHARLLSQFLRPYH